MSGNAQPLAEIPPPPATEFWRSVRELAAMRRQIPDERRAMSGVRLLMREAE